MATASEIQSLLDAGAYSAESVSTLEQYVDAQLNSATPYHFHANRTLAKLYQFFPDSANPTVLARILTLAVLQFPKTDVLPLTCLIPEVTQGIEPISTIIRCFELLDACKFKEFWTLWTELECNDADLKPLLQRQQQQLRQGIVNVLALSYRAAPIRVVQVALNVDTIDPSLYQNKIESISDTQVRFLATADNTKRTHVFQEGLKFSAISSFVASSQ